MTKSCKKFKCFVTCALVVFIGLWTSGIPAVVLTKKPANNEALYSAGWEQGCQSGISAMAPMRALLAAQPFIKEDPKINHDNYKTGWNEGYTSCRFFQDAWFNVMAVFLIILTLVATRCRCGKSDAQCTAEINAKGQ